VEVVGKPLYTCISEGLMHIAAEYHGTPEKVHEICAKVSSGQTHNAAKFRCASRKRVRGIPCETFCFPEK